jgi:hypothetical protein
MKHAPGATRRILVKTSPHALPNLVVCVDRGAIRWRGAIEGLTTAIPFDSVYCHDDDADIVRSTVASLNGAPCPNDG